MFIPLGDGTILRLLGSPLAVLVTLLVNFWCLFLGSLWYLLLGPAVREGWRGWHLVSRVPRCPGNLADRDLAVAYPLPWYWDQSLTPWLAPRSPGASVGTHPAVRWRSACAGGGGVPLSGTRSRCAPCSPSCPCRAAPSSAPPRPPEDGSSLNIAVCEIKTRTKMQSMELLYKRSN